jgi:hypothetical protein
MHFSCAELEGTDCRATKPLFVTVRSHAVQGGYGDENAFKMKKYDARFLKEYIFKSGMHPGRAGG